jgi:ABC-type transporter Mla subunit MlaD
MTRAPRGARLVGLVAATALLLFAFTTFAAPALPWNRVLHLQVEASAFGEINPGAWVELGGAKVGSVERVDFRSGHSLLHLKVDRQYAGKIHADARAWIRPHGLLGPNYVYLEGGQSGQVHDGAVIPLSRTTVSVDFDDVLNALQPDVRNNLKVIFTELGRAADGRGAEMNTAFRSLGSSTADVSSTTAVLRARDDDLAGLIVASERLDRDLQHAPIDRNIADTDSVLRALVAVDRQLGDGVDQTAAVMQRLDVALGGNSSNLASALRTAPGTVSHLRTVASQLDGIVTGINPALPSLMQALMEAKSAFAGKDANGHFVRVQALSPGSATGPDQTVSLAHPLQDRDLIALFLGD